MPSLNLLLFDPLRPTLIWQIQNGAEPESKKTTIPALIDTGFDGFLTLPVSFAKKLGLKVIGTSQVELANSKQYLVRIAEAYIQIPDLYGYLFNIEAILTDDQEALIGTRFLDMWCNSFTLNFKNSRISFDCKKL